MLLEVRVGLPCLDPAPVAAWSDAMLWQHVTVDSAAWGLFGSVVGTAVGAFLTLLGSWNVARVEGRRAAESERRKTDAVRRQEQRAAYLRLLMICRQLRTLARAGRDRQQRPGQCRSRAIGTRRGDRRAGPERHLARPPLSRYSLPLPRRVFPGIRRPRPNRSARSPSNGSATRSAGCQES